MPGLHEARVLENDPSVEFSRDCPFSKAHICYTIKAGKFLVAAKLRKVLSAPFYEKFRIRADPAGNGDSMYITEYMTSDPITVSPETLLPEARRMLNEHRIRHLPVVDRQKKLIGIVSDRDLRSAYPSSVSSNREKMLSYEQVERATVADMMTTSCSTLSIEASLDDALLLFDEEKIGVIPVVSEDNVVVGIFSLLDLITAYRKLFGVAEKGSVLVGIEDDERENILSDIVTMLDRNGILLTRLIRLSEKDRATKIFMRISSRKPAEVFKLFRSRGFVLLEP